MLVRIDPARTGYATLTLLEPGETGTNYDVSHNSEPVIAGLKVGAGSVEGAMKSTLTENTAGYSIRFSSPLGAAPAVTAALKGDAVRSSPAYVATSAWVDALGRGDMAAARVKSSGAVRAQLEGNLAAEGSARTAEDSDAGGA